MTDDEGLQTRVTRRTKFFELTLAADVNDV